MSAQPTPAAEARAPIVAICDWCAGAVDAGVRRDWLGYLLCEACDAIAQEDQYSEDWS